MISHCIGSAQSNGQNHSRRHDRLLIWFDRTIQTVIFQGFTIKFRVFLNTGDYQSHAVGVGFHHDIDGLGLGHTSDRLHESPNDILHRVKVIVVEQDAITGGGFTDSGSRTLLDNFCRHRLSPLLNSLIES
jgi:hypothetical protein